ncbi:uncharacterized protein [Lepeophtheirus salmonis]|uniref:uncharacterized protein isoform X1 n=1 Tax=Lepeophtheirus salmonis TaxID=72036 RepID=UPI003AF3856A
MKQQFCLFLWAFISPIMGQEEGMINLTCQAFPKSVFKLLHPMNCIFPFSLGSYVYKTCISMYISNKPLEVEYQCPIVISEHDDSITEWGICRPECPKKGCQDKLNTSSCIFPYQYGDKMWHTCVPAMNGFLPNGEFASKLFCPTSLDKEAKPLVTSLNTVWRECGIDCPVLEAFKPVTLNTYVPTEAATLPYVELVQEVNDNSTNETKKK